MRSCCGLPAEWTYSTPENTGQFAFILHSTVSDVSCNRQKAVAVKVNARRKFKLTIFSYHLSCVGKEPV